jgi:hypothetical protein
MTHLHENNMLNRSIEWLSSKKMLNIILIILYSLAILFLHDPIVKITLQIKDRLTLPVFNYIVGVASITVFIIFLAVLFNELLKNKTDRTLKLFFLITTSGVVVLHTQIMFEMSIEIIHSLEYSILAFLIFPAFKRYGAAVIFSLPVMLIDEWMQYEIMYKSYVEYFELNDVLMDVLGCGFMMLIIWIFGAKSENFKHPFWKNAEIVFLALISITITVLILTCIVSLYPDTACNHTWLVLNRLKNPDSFWQIHPVHGSTYHVLQPVKGLVIILIACIFFSSIDIFKSSSHGYLKKLPV